MNCVGTKNLFFVSGLNMRAPGLIVANQCAKSNDEALALPHTVLQKILVSSSIIEAQRLRSECTKECPRLVKKNHCSFR
jgi:hypothetical protein